MNRPACQGCRFWERGKTGKWNAETKATELAPADWGDCRRYAPRGPFVINQPDGGEPWPFASTGEAEWCGEFEARPQTGDEPF